MQQDKAGKAGFKQEKAYLVYMRENLKVQFVCFETKLAKEPFIKRWEQFNRSAKSDADVTLQQSEKNGTYLYIAQHRFVNDETQFVFSKENRSSRVARERITTNHAGGYAVIQAEKLQEASYNESKVFVFLTDHASDLDLYKRLSEGGKLNIYQAYYENCKYAYILEYFIKTKLAEALLGQLQDYDITETGIYKEWSLPKNANPKKKEGNYVWPTF
jgi:hypothetical protein